ncbi:MAG: DUF3307 domain-containing protein [Candidatus Limisoma sp.]
MMNITILLKLLFAHILSDFFFQSDKICEGKQSKTNNKHAYQLLHSLTHATVAYLFVADLSNWIIPSVIFITHALMDYLKVEYMKKNAVSFIVDQLVHVAVIVVLWLSLFNSEEVFCQEILCSKWNSLNIWAVVIAYLLVLKPTSVFLSLFIKRWEPSATAENSLPNAGKWIGYFERILILTFILTGNAEGIGFLLAAKSIFRFGELSKAQEIRTTEYVLIGTFASFTIAILIGFCILQIID